MLPCDPPWLYRNKMEFSFSQNKAGELFLGLMMASTRGLVFHLSECHLSDAFMPRVVCAVRQWWQRHALTAYHYRKNTGSLQTLTIREGKRTGDRMVVLSVSGNPDAALSQSVLDDFVKTVCRACSDKEEEENLSVFLRIHQRKKGEQSRFYEWKLYGQESLREDLSFRGKKFRFSYQSFSFFSAQYTASRKALCIGP